MSAMTELLSCPFCGGEAMLLKDHKNLGVYVACTVCHVCGKTGLKSEVVEHWNHRNPVSASSRTHGSKMRPVKGRK